MCHDIVPFVRVVRVHYQYRAGMAGFARAGCALCTRCDSGFGQRLQRVDPDRKCGQRIPKTVILSLPKSSAEVTRTVCKAASVLLFRRFRLFRRQSGDSLDDLHFVLLPVIVNYKELALFDGELHRAVHRQIGWL